MGLNTVTARLLALEERMERVERLSYLCYVETRRIADYAYLNVRLEADPETIKRIPGIRNPTDDQALKAGLSVMDVAALKIKQRFLARRCRDDFFEIARYIAEERERDPAVVEEQRDVA